MHISYKYFFFYRHEYFELAFKVFKKKIFGHCTKMVIPSCVRDKIELKFTSKTDADETEVTPFYILLLLVRNILLSVGLWQIL